MRVTSVVALSVALGLSACSSGGEPTTDEAVETTVEEEAEDTVEEPVERVEEEPDQSWIEALYDYMTPSEREEFCSLFNAAPRETYEGLLDSVAGPAGQGVDEADLPTYDEFFRVLDRNC